MKRILLDTNAYAYLLAGNKQVLEAISEADQVFLSALISYDRHFSKISGLRRWPSL